MHDAGAADEPMDAFAEVERAPDGGEWFRPTGLCRGPWDPDACHAGPPTALLARASERLVPDQQLVRVTVELTRPIPHAGFAIEASIARAGRTVTTTELAIVGADGRTAATARGMHLTTADVGPVTTVDTALPPFAAATPGPFPIRGGSHDLPMFSAGVEVRYPPGDGPTPGPTRLWMRTVPIVRGEVPSPFQRLCPLADCGNGVSRNAETTDLVFMNTDLTVAVHRPPVGEWIGIEAVSRWEPNGIGMSDALLFDERGTVGRAMQSLVIRRR